MNSPRVRMGGGLLLAAGLCLGSDLPAITQMPEPESQTTRPPTQRPYSCEFIKKIALDILDDDVEMPEAATQTYLMMEGNQKELPFQVYALTNEVRFYKALSDYPRQVSFRFRGTGGRDPLRLRVRYSEEGGDPHWVLRVVRRPRRWLTITMLVTYTCPAPRAKYQTKLILTVPGRAPRPE